MLSSSSSRLLVYLPFPFAWIHSWRVLSWVDYINVVCVFSLLLRIPRDLIGVYICCANDGPSFCLRAYRCGVTRGAKKEPRRPRVKLISLLLSVSYENLQIVAKMVRSTISRFNIYHVLCFFLPFGTVFGFYKTAPNIIVFMADDLVSYIDKKNISLDNCFIKHRIFN